MADKIRPQSLDDIAGQEHLVGRDGILRKLCEAGRLGSMIFFGPPGTGKTTTAEIIAKQSGMRMIKLNATNASISDVKDAIAQTEGFLGEEGILLYLDEIQYFNRKQQQSLLECVEDGRVTLIASTTENPYFYIYNALLSRSSVFEFKSVEPKDTAKVLRRAWDVLCDTYGAKKDADEDALIYIAKKCGGDVRMSVGLLENAFFVTAKALDTASVDALSANARMNYDKSGDGHYDLLSALQKSIRGSDVDAAIFYLASLLEAGELISASRRLQVIASEDIGAAYPLASAITYACCRSAIELGMPEASIPLSNAVVMLATSPKSNSAHIAYEKAAADVRAGLGKDIPKHLQSPLFEGYKYPHDYPCHYVEQRYMPMGLERTYYDYAENRTEQTAKNYWADIKKKKK